MRGTIRARERNGLIGRRWHALVSVLVAHHAVNVGELFRADLSGGNAAIPGVARGARAARRSVGRAAVGVHDHAAIASLAGGAVNVGDVGCLAHLLVVNRTKHLLRLLLVTRDASDRPFVSRDLRVRLLGGGRDSGHLGLRPDACGEEHGNDQ